MIDEIKKIDFYLKNEGRNWERFVIARAATCFGFHEYCFIIFHELSSNISSISLHYWLKSLSLFSFAEFIISLSTNSNEKPNIRSLLASAPSDIPSFPFTNQQICLSTSIGYLIDSLTSLKAAKLKNSELTFQEKFIHLRQEFVVHAVGLLAEIPLLQHNCSSSSFSSFFIQLAAQFQLLRRCFFDIDQFSIFTLESYQINCFLISHAIDIFIGNNRFLIFLFFYLTLITNKIHYIFLVRHLTPYYFNFPLDRRLLIIHARNMQLSSRS